MPAIKTGKKTEKYTTEFKVKAVEWSHQAHRSVKSVAEALDIHPFTLSCCHAGERNTVRGNSP
jgi:transposase